MIDLLNYKFLGTVFTPDFNVTNFLKIANTIVDIMGDKLDGPPNIINIPHDAPPEIPRIMLSSADGTLNVSVALNRTNMSHEFIPQQDSQGIDLDADSRAASSFFAEYQKQLDLRIQRLGFVTERVAYKEDALTYLLERFCNENQITAGRPFNNARRFEIHSMKKYPWLDFDINSWVRLRYFPIAFGDKSKKEPKLLVTNDLNTLSFDEDPGARFDNKAVSSFFDNAASEVEDILALYFI